MSNNASRTNTSTAFSTIPLSPGLIKRGISQQENLCVLLMGKVKERRKVIKKVNVRNWLLRYRN